MRFYYTFCSIQNYQLIADLLIRGGECDFLLDNSPLHSHTDDNVPDTNVTICCVGSNFYIQPNISKEIKFQKLFPFFSIILQF